MILASWCGKKVVPDRIINRPGWSEIPAVRNGRIVAGKSAGAPLSLPAGTPTRVSVGGVSYRGLSTRQVGEVVSADSY